MPKYSIDPNEILVRIIKRLPIEASREMDELDFNRNKSYRKTGKPENGISVFRLKLIALDQIYSRLHGKWWKGAAACKVSKLHKDLKCLVAGANDEHISLRCINCNEAQLPEICQPAGDRYQPININACPLFENDPYGLVNTFELIDPIQFRATPSALSQQEK